MLETSWRPRRPAAGAVRPPPWAREPWRRCRWWGPLPRPLAEYFSDTGRVATRTGIGVAEGIGGAATGKTLGGLIGPAEGNLPRAKTEALIEMERRRQQMLAAPRKQTP
jgi:hypothetical protein